MIVSASRRTDIPALFSEWFYNRVKAGFVLLRNPYNFHQVGRVTLTPDKVEGIVFWTKNAAPMLPRIHELEDFKYYFQFTITAYERDIERNLPDKQEVIIPAFKKIGTDKVIWRYDPILINKRYTWDYHIRAFTKLAEKLEGFTRKAVMSYVDAYRGVNLAAIGVQHITLEQQREMAQQLAEIAMKHGIKLTACAEDVGLPPARCVDATMFGLRKPKDNSQRGLCACAESVDIGAYNTCSNGCTYCYANHYGYVKPMADPNCELLGAPLTGSEKIKQRN